MSSDAVLPRHDTNLFTIALPPLGMSELQSAVEYKIQSSSPVPLAQMAKWYHAVRTPQGWTVWVFVTFEGQIPSGMRVRSGLPLRWPRTPPARGLAALTTQEGVVVAEYRNGWLTKFSRPGLSAAVFQGWTDGTDVPRIAVEWEPGAVWPFTLPDDFVPASERWPATLDPPLSQRLERPRRPVMPAVLALLGTLVLLAAGWYSLETKTERNNAWKVWVKQNSQPVIAAVSDETWKSWLDATGVPLVGILDRLSRLWNNGVEVTSFSVRGRHLVLEGVSASGVRSFEHLVADGWFREMKLITLKPRTDGREDFLIDGEVALDP